MPAEIWQQPTRRSRCARHGRPTTNGASPRAPSSRCSSAARAASTRPRWLWACSHGSARPRCLLPCPAPRRRATKVVALRGICWLICWLWTRCTRRVPPPGAPQARLDGPSQAPMLPRLSRRRPLCTCWCVLCRWRNGSCCCRGSATSSTRAAARTTLAHPDTALRERRGIALMPSSSPLTPLIRLLRVPAWACESKWRRTSCACRA